MDNESEMFNSYTPFRNHLRKMKLIDSLQAIHYHILHQQFGKPLPSFIGAQMGYRNAKSFRDFIPYHLSSWELEIIAKEVIINSPYYGMDKSLASWHQMASAVNKLKALEGRVSQLYSNKENVLVEFHRIAHRQFSWQRSPHTGNLAQYWKFYSYPGLSTIVEKKIGLSVDKLFIISMSLMGNFLKNFILWYPPEIKVKNINQKNLDIFLNQFCKSHTELKDVLKKELQINQKYAYAYHSLKAFPLVKMEINEREALACPVLTLFFRRITEGIYYEICNAEGFEKYFGDSFQSYVGEMLVANKNSNTFLFDEKKYGKPEKKTTDWIFGDKSALVFIECKSKRLTLEAKINLTNLSELEKQLGILADGILQVYKGVGDYKNGKYPQVKYNEKLDLYPIIVTLEEWFLFGDSLIPMLEKAVKRKLKESGLSVNMILQHPYTVCSIEGLNMIAAASKSFTLKDILHEKLFNSDKKLWHLDTYLKSKYGEEVLQFKTYGEDEFNEFIDKEIATNM